MKKLRKLLGISLIVCLAPLGLTACGGTPSPEQPGSELPNSPTDTISLAEAKQMFNVCVDGNNCDVLEQMGQFYIDIKDKIEATQSATCNAHYQANAIYQNGTYQKYILSAEYDNTDDNDEYFADNIYYLRQDTYVPQVTAVDTRDGVLSYQGDTVTIHINNWDDTRVALYYENTVLIDVYQWSTEEIDEVNHTYTFKATKPGNYQARLHIYQDDYTAQTQDYEFTVEKVLTDDITVGTGANIEKRLYVMETVKFAFSDFAFNYCYQDTVTKTTTDTGYDLSFTMDELGMYRFTILRYQTELTDEAEQKIAEERAIIATRPEAWQSLKNELVLTVHFNTNHQITGITGSLSYLMYSYKTNPQTQAKVITEWGHETASYEIVPDDSEIITPDWV